MIIFRNVMRGGLNDLFSGTDQYLPDVIPCRSTHVCIVTSFFLVFLFTGTICISSASADGSGSLNSSFRYALCGFYVTGGTGLHDSGRGDITLTGIPPGAVIVEAYLYWTVKTTGAATPADGSGVFAGNTITGTFIGWDDDPCWDPNTRSSTFRAIVTPYVTGDGTYPLTGFTLGCDGAGEVVVRT